MEIHRDALLIGSWNYKHTQLRKLASPVRDVRDLAAVLSDPQIGAFRVNVLENRTAQEIRVELENFFSGRSPDDFLVLYFSGHGLKNEQGHFYFAACDTDPQRLLATGIDAHMIHQVLQRCRSRKKILLIDSCFGGAVAKGLVVKSGDQITPDQITGDASGLVILTATDSMTYAFEGDKVSGDAQPSVFTKHLVNGLRTGEADLGHDGDVTIEELFTYVRTHVREEVPNQTPKKWELEAAGDLVIAKNANPLSVLLPKYLQELIDHPLAVARFTAIEQLTALADRPQTKRIAIAALERLSTDDSRQVSVAASSAISKLGITVPLTRSFASNQTDKKTVSPGVDSNPRIASYRSGLFGLSPEWESEWKARRAAELERKARARLNSPAFYRLRSWWVSIAVTIGTVWGTVLLTDWLVSWAVGAFNLQLPNVNSIRAVFAFVGLVWAVTYTVVATVVYEDDRDRGWKAFYFRGILGGWNLISKDFELWAGLAGAFPLTVVAGWCVSQGLAQAAFFWLHADFSILFQLAIGVYTVVTAALYLLVALENVA